MLGRWLAVNRDRFRTDGDLAAELQITGGRLSQILGGNGGQVRPQLAIRFHRVTRGEVPGNLWRPDLWRSPADVPVDLGGRQ